MITQQQAKDLASYYQIDEFTIFREYLQLVLLSYLYRQPKANKVYFKGGTAIHLLFGSPRFSEDLDFSTPYSKKQTKEVIKQVKKEITQELVGAKIYILYEGKKSIRFRLKYESPNFKYPFVIRIDFNERQKPQKAVNSPLVTKFPLVFPVVSHLSDQEILAEKIRALLTRGKGRDVFDLWFLLAKGVKIDQSLARKKLKEVDKEFSREILVRKVKVFPLKRLQKDLGKFLPHQQREIIKDLRERLVELI